MTSVEKMERRKWWCCQSVVGLFFLSFLALRNFEFPAKIKKGGGKDPPDPLVESAVTCEWLLRRVVVEINVSVHGGYCYRRRGGK